MASSENKNSRIILMFPWLAHGHIFPFLELAKKILNKKNFKFYICSTPINLPSITNFIQKNSLQNSIKPVELHLPTNNPDLPPHLHTTKNLPSHLIHPLIKAFQEARSSFADKITTIKPDLIIFDIFQPWAAKLASSLSILAVHFSIFGAASRASIHYNSYDPNFPFPELYLNDRDKTSIDRFRQFLSLNVYDREEYLMFGEVGLSSEIVLVKTSRALEDKYLDYLSFVHSKRILCVGPLVGDAAADDEASSEILQWLTTKPQNSTVYVSFGSEVSLSERMVVEMARGLEICETNFIWVMRSPGGLAQEFRERLKKRGKIVMGWAPQTRILGHPSTAAFVSHCGWSSLNESLYYGVPLVGLPLRGDMFVDTKMVAHAGVCVEVGRDGNGEFRGEDVAAAVAAASEGEMRRRARELSEKMREEEERDVEQAADSLWQLCCKNQNI